MKKVIFFQEYVGSDGDYWYKDFVGSAYACART